MNVRRVAMMTDIEGVAGVVSFASQAFTNGKYYEDAKKLLTAEVNAAVRGMVSAGVEEVLVIDGHGPGAICYEELDSPAELLHGRPYPRAEINDLISECDAAVMVGQHAMAGVKYGNMNHTQSSGTVEYYKLNGEDIGEIAQYALKCGTLDIPLIFLSGDRAACDEVEKLIPGITTASVKRGLSRAAAISLSSAASRELIEKSIETAVLKHKEKPVEALKIPGPYVLEKKFLFTEIADSFVNNPLYEIVDSKTVRLKSDNILDIISS